MYFSIFVRAVINSLIIRRVVIHGDEACYPRRMLWFGLVLFFLSGRPDKSQASTKSHIHGVSRYKVASDVVCMRSSITGVRASLNLLRPEYDIKRGHRWARICFSNNFLENVQILFCSVLGFVRKSFILSITFDF